MSKKLHIKVGDNVKVIAGNSKNATGQVKSIDRIKNRAAVEGVNMIKVHKKPSASNPQGGIVEQEGTIHISNLMLVNSKGEASRIGRKKNKDGKSVRVTIKGGEEL
jgi:large subunit ribosomal protein L24